MVRGNGGGGALTEKLVVDGWWLLVNEGEGVPRLVKVCGLGGGCGERVFMYTTCEGSGRESEGVGG